MEIVRDWLLGKGLSETAAIAGAVVAAVLVSVLIGWVLRAIAGVPVAHFSEGWGHWKNAIKRFNLLNRLAWVIAAIAAKYLVPASSSPAGRGIPVEIYVFSSDTRWEHYEKLQAEIIDHVLAVLPMFELRVFQEPTGEDLRSRDVPQLQDQR